ncbi:MAG: glutamate--cysteine ligase [Candidatus Sedimenticola sp. (ex Thyasira tokunagai)]
MGQEIADSRFSPEDFQEFSRRLKQETQQLAEWFADGAFSSSEPVGGFELEAWLVNSDAQPAPLNTQLIERLGDPLVVPELARFNLELNGDPQPLRGGGLSLMADGLTATWNRCRQVAGELDGRLAMVGILPTVQRSDFSLKNMSSMQRYHALDEQLARLRQGSLVQIDIEGRDHLRFTHDDVMLEAATTSFQIHLKLAPASSGRFYNAAKILAAPMVALSANSPFLFGSALWDETRIPLFEQAVSVGDSLEIKRVTMGTRYVSDSVMECFQVNCDRYPVLLPRLMDEPGLLPHLRLHNGTIWRWNRPLLGFNDAGDPHLRLEHRVVPAGPSIIDSIANAAFFFGAVTALGEMTVPPEQQLSFEDVQSNFYRSAEKGLGADVVWLDGKGVSAADLCRQLLPLARQGLESLGVERREVDYWLGIIHGRLANGQNGAVWQRAWVACHGNDSRGLTEAYMERQESGLPVHEWSV